jgi:hypothetical protein
MLQISGGNLFDANVAFRIVTSDGVEIYSLDFSIDRMMERGPEDRRTIQDSLNILRALDHFFDEGNFTSPAIEDTTDFARANFISQDQWLPFWLDKTSIGFYFQLGAEEVLGIGYSRSKRKAVQFFACC